MSHERFSFDTELRDDSLDVRVVCEIEHGSPQTFWEPATPDGAYGIEVYDRATDELVEITEEEEEALADLALRRWYDDLKERYR